MSVVKRLAAQAVAARLGSHADSGNCGNSAHGSGAFKSEVLNSNSRKQRPSKTRWNSNTRLGRVRDAPGLVSLAQDAWARGPDAAASGCFGEGACSGGGTGAVVWGKGGFSGGFSLSQDAAENAARSKRVTRRNEWSMFNRSTRENEPPQAGGLAVGRLTTFRWPGRSPVHHRCTGSRCRAGSRRASSSASAAWPERHRWRRWGGRARWHRPRR